MQGFTNCTSRYEFLNTPKQSKDTEVITSDCIFLSTPTLTTNGSASIDICIYIFAFILILFTYDTVRLFYYRIFLGDNEPTRSLKSVAVLQQMSISALIVASGATSVLASIQSSWPDFSALRNNSKGIHNCICAAHHINS